MAKNPLDLPGIQRSATAGRVAKVGLSQLSPKMELRWYPKFIFSPTIEQVEVLMELSRNHYDGACKAASSERNGAMGFIAGWRNGVLHFSKDWKMHASWHELDICLKTLEGRPQLKDAEKRHIADDIARAFNAAMDVATVRSAELNQKEKQ